MILAALSVLGSDEERKELNDIYSENAGRFFNIAFQKLNNREDAEDAVQEAFLRIAEIGDTFFDIPDHKKAAFIDVIIRNVAVDMFKKRSKMPVIPLEDDHIDDTYSIEDYIIGDIFKNDIIKFIMSEIPEEKQQAVFLRVHFKLTNAQTAHCLGITETAVRKRISDACRMIKKYVKGEWP